MEGYDDIYEGWATRRNARHWHWFDGSGWALCNSGHGMRAFRLIKRLDSDLDLYECSDCKRLLEASIARGKRPLVVGKRTRQWGD